MKREVKFRVWDGKIMYFPCDENDLFLKIGDGGYFQVEDHSPEHFKETPTKNGHKDLAIINSLDNENLELIEFTGLKDKEGVEVYEGDYLRYTRVNWECHDHPENGTDLTHCCLIYWDDEKHGFGNDMREGNSMSGRVFSSGYLGFEDNRADECIIEVIGNKYENPELLK